MHMQSYVSQKSTREGQVFSRTQHNLTEQRALPQLPVIHYL